MILAEIKLKNRRPLKLSNSKQLANGFLKNWIVKVYHSRKKKQKQINKQTLNLLFIKLEIHDSESHSKFFKASRDIQVFH